MYRLEPKIISEQTGQIIGRDQMLRLSDNAFIPFDPANTDFQKFKADLAEGVELQDPEGAPMTPAAVAEFIKSLP